MGTHGKMRPKDRPLEGDFVSDEDFEEMLREWFGNIARVLEPGRAFYIWGGYANCGNYPPVMEECGLYFSQSIIWVKGHPVLTRKDFMGNHKWCFYGWREGAAHQFFGPDNAPDVWRFERHPAEGVDLEEKGVSVGERVRLESADGDRIDVAPPEPQSVHKTELPEGESVAVYGGRKPSDVWMVKKISPQKMVHLTEKPVELARRAMRYSSRRGENVLDLFGGSGSTLIAAEQMERRAFLMDMDPLYCDVIVERWENFTGRKAQRIPVREGEDAES